MRDDIEKILLNEESLSGIVKELGAKISEDYRGKRLLMISILKGSVVFMADLLRAITIPCRIDFMAVSSYGSGVKTSGVVKIVKDLDINLEGYDLLIVEDILAHHKFIRHTRAHIIRSQVNLTALRFIKQRADTDALGIAGG